MNSEEEFKKVADRKAEQKDANMCIAIGAGIGVFGATSALLVGAVCPICVVVAPGLVGVGAFQRWKLSKENKEN